MLHLSVTAQTLLQADGVTSLNKRVSMFLLLLPLRLKSWQSSLDLLAPLCLMQPRSCFAPRTHRWLMISLVSIRTLKSISAKLLSSWSAPSLCWYLGLFLPGTGLGISLVLKFIRFLVAHFCSLARSLWMAEHPPGLLTTPPSFISSANLLRVHPVLSSSSLMKGLKGIGPSVD